MAWAQSSFVCYAKVLKKSKGKNEENNQKQTEHQHFILTKITFFFRNSSLTFIYNVETFWDTLVSFVYVYVYT